MSLVLVEQYEILDILNKDLSHPDTFIKLYKFLENNTRWAFVAESGFSLEDEPDFSKYVLDLMACANILDSLPDSISSLLNQAASKNNPLEQSKLLLLVAIAIDRSCQNLSLSHVFFSTEDIGRRYSWQKQYLKNGYFNFNMAEGYLIPKAASPSRGQSLSLYFKNLSWVSLKENDLIIKPHRAKSFTKSLGIKIETKIKISIIPLIFSKNEMEWSLVKHNGINYHKVIPKPSKTVKLCNRLKYIFKCLEKDKVDIIIFPELVFNNKMIETVKILLCNTHHKISLCFCGTKLQYNEEESLPFNACIVLNAEGREIFVQNKINRYKMTEREKKDAKLVEILGRKDTDEFCSISSRTLNFLDTPKGRFCVLICEDFVRKAPFNGIIESLGVSHMIVPVMDGDGLWSWTEAVHKKSEPGAASIVVNSGILLKNKKGSIPKRTTHITHPKHYFPKPEIPEEEYMKDKNILKPLHTDLKTNPYTIVLIPNII